MQSSAQPCAAEEAILKRKIVWFQHPRRCFTHLLFRIRALLLTTALLVTGFTFYHIYTTKSLRESWAITPKLLQEPPQCSPKINLAFLKTHKTAGTSIQNIFLRYGQKHNLTFILPARNNYIGHPEYFSAELVPRLKPGVTYNILCHHTRFNYDEIKSVLPADTLFITILRDPVYLFESIYGYYRLNRTFGMPLSSYSLYDTTNFTILRHHNRRFYRKIGRNQMMFDLGLSVHKFDDETTVRQYIASLDHKFDLVMIAEQMDESLVLLRHMLCWDLDDVVAFKHNARLPTRKVPLDSQVIEGLRKWNRADQMLYNHFRNRFQELVRAFGVDRMQWEVAELQGRIQAWHDYCVEKETSSRSIDSRFKTHSNQVLNFELKSNINNITCENLAKAELPYTAELRLQQMHLWRNTASKSPDSLIRDRTSSSLSRN